jgi:hypothetical protein
VFPGGQGRNLAQEPRVTPWSTAQKEEKRKYIWGPDKEVLDRKREQALAPEK